MFYKHKQTLRVDAETKTQEFKRIKRNTCLFILKYLKLTYSLGVLLRDSTYKRVSHELQHDRAIVVV